MAAAIAAAAVAAAAMAAMATAEGNGCNDSSSRGDCRGEGNGGSDD